MWTRPVSSEDIIGSTSSLSVKLVFKGGKGRVSVLKCKLMVWPGSRLVSIRVKLIHCGRWSLDWHTFRMPLRLWLLCWIHGGEDEPGVNEWDMFWEVGGILEAGTSVPKSSKCRFVFVESRGELQSIRMRIKLYSEVWFTSYIRRMRNLRSGPQSIASRICMGFACHFKT